MTTSYKTARKCLVYRPDPKIDIQRLMQLFEDKIPFSFVRFSDGEMEIIRGRNLIIQDGMTVFRGRHFKNNFPSYDKKNFCPKKHYILRRDVLASALYSNTNYFKGVPARHNNSVCDQNLMVRLNGGLSKEITFADLFINQNYPYSVYCIFPKIVEMFKHKYVICNVRSNLVGFLSDFNKIQIEDDVFSKYEAARDDISNYMMSLPSGALVLSSASSLSNVVGHFVHVRRPDVTFLDLGTMLNQFLGLDDYSRDYHALCHDGSMSGHMRALRYKLRKHYRMKW